MERKPSNQESKRTSLAITLRWISISFALYIIGTIAKAFADNTFTFVLADFRTWIPLLDASLTWGVIPLISVCFSQLASYFWPEDVSINNLERIMARLAIGASAGYLLLIPMYIIAYASMGLESPGFPVILISCFRCLALSLGFIGASRTRNGQGSPFLRNSVESPLDHLLKRSFRKEWSRLSRRRWTAGRPAGPPTRGGG
jgi:hypothetical protein